MTVPEARFWGPQLAVLADVLDDVDRAGAVVVGGPGAGKTSVVRAALREAGADSLALQCSGALAEVAYGALSPFLADLDDIRGPVDVLRAVQHHLDALAGSGGRLARRPVVVVEDSQFLDAASAFVLAQLAQNREAVLLATSVGLRGGSGLHALVDAGLLATVAIPPLSREQTRAMCRSLVGGAPTDGAVRTVLGMTGGSPRLVAAFLDSAADQGLLVREPGADADTAARRPWTLVRPAPSIDERLAVVVEGMHAELTEEQQLAVTMIALAGRMPRAQLRVVAGDQGRDLAEAHVTRDAPDGQVELSSTLYGELLRAATPPGQSSALLARWGAAGGTVLRPPPARSVAWAMDNGLPVPEEDRMAAGYELLAAGDLDTAWSVANPGPSTDPRLCVLRAEVMLAEARTWSGRADLVELADTTTDERLATEVLCALAMDLVRCGEQPTSADALARVWADHLVRSRHASRTPAITGVSADWLGALGAFGDSTEAPRLLDLSAGLLADPATSAALRCSAHWLRMRLLTRAGRLVEASREAALAYDEATRTPRMTALMGGHAMVQLVVCQVLAGEADAAERVLDDQRHGPVLRWHAWSGTVAALEGFVAMVRGRLGPGARALRDAALDLAQADPAHLLPLVQAAYALLTRAADPGSDGGPSAADRVAAATRRGPHERWLLARGIAAVADDLGRSGTDQPLQWQEFLDDPELDEHPVVRREVLFSAWSTRDPAADHDELLARLHDACAAVDGPRSALLRQACDPRDAADWVRLVRVADTVRAAGEPALAADVWARVVQLHHRAGDLRRRGEALRHLQDVVQVLGGVPSRAVSAALDLGALTEREQEIVRLALEGRTNAEIAEVLVVSPRTVEGHLYRVFTKLGISDRSELRDIHR